MSKKAYDKIAEGLSEVLVIARGDATPARLHTPVEIDVSAIRARLKLSQEGFADAFGFAIGQIRDWERGRTVPTGGVRAYLTLIGARPDDVLGLIAQVRGPIAAE